MDCMLPLMEWCLGCIVVNILVFVEVVVSLCGVVSQAEVSLLDSQLFVWVVSFVANPCVRGTRHVGLVGWCLCSVLALKSILLPGDMGLNLAV